MSKLTITEALAEIKMLGKKIEKKQQFVATYACRQSIVKDPHEKAGGSEKLLAQELQAIADLRLRWVALRSAIAQSNQETVVEICGSKKTLADWIVWRREVAQGQRQFKRDLLKAILDWRRQIERNLTANSTDEEKSEAEYIVNVDETYLSNDLEKIEETLDTLDGQLSLKNATTFVEF